MELLIVTGMSGSGKSKAIELLEDIGYYCIDNMPSRLISKFVELCSQLENKLNRVAIVVDARGRELFSNVVNELSTLISAHQEYKILFINCDDDIIMKRYKETRRTHPLIDIDNNDIEKAILKERQMLQSIKDVSDYVIDTSHISVSQLRETLNKTFLENVSHSMLINTISFGFKYGIPTNADLVFDVRCLPNPFYVPELKHKTGLDKEVSDFVMKYEQSQGVLKHLISLVDYMIPLYIKEGKSQLIIGIGCTGGKHRSITFAKLMDEHFSQSNYKHIVTHRDIEK